LTCAVLGRAALRGGRPLAAGSFTLVCPVLSVARGYGRTACKGGRALVPFRTRRPVPAFPIPRFSAGGRVRSRLLPRATAARASGTPGEPRPCWGARAPVERRPGGGRGAGRRPRRRDAGRGSDLLEGARPSRAGPAGVMPGNPILRADLRRRWRHDVRFLWRSRGRDLCGQRRRRARREA
jgi:hypothetical protein